MLKNGKSCAHSITATVHAREAEPMTEKFWMDLLQARDAFFNSACQAKAHPTSLSFVLA
jgi:hypothetical protein